MGEGEIGCTKDKTLKALMILMVWDLGILNCFYVQGYAVQSSLRACSASSFDQRSLINVAAPTSNVRSPTFNLSTSPFNFVLCTSTSFGTKSLFFNSPDPLTSFLNLVLQPPLTPSKLSSFNLAVHLQPHLSSYHHHLPSKSAAAGLSARHPIPATP